MDPPTPPFSSTFDLYRPLEVFVMQPPRRRYWLHALLFLLTVFTTLVVGARLQFNYINDHPAFSFGHLFPIAWALSHPERLLLGIPFSATLLGILLAHEMGHFFYCIRNGVYATLPYFLPAPTLIGTLGAFIRIRSPIRSRAALFDIGIAGPIAGFVVGILALAAALALSKPLPLTAADSDIQFGYPLIFHVVHHALALLGLSQVPGVPLNQLYLHPTAIAAWVGMFATALNLLPGGQLDGGHIVYALNPRRHRVISRATVMLLILLAVFWSGWLVWSLLLMVTGMRHPRVPLEPGLDRSRHLLALFGLLMLLLTFVPAPFRGAGLYSLFH
jgi:membrane-associated protease RseP (regulator of RpoE activity)